MKVRIECDSSVAEEEVIIKCTNFDDNIKKLKEEIENNFKKTKTISFYKDKKEFYIPLKDILFFETSSNHIDAHTKDDIYKVKNKLYELDDLLNKNFIKISKSAIVNINKIYSITHNITSSSLIDFYNSHKKVYVSRFYLKNLKNNLEERRNI
jgi:Response regulator of the LytR/AlgR family